MQESLHADRLDGRADGVIGLHLGRRPHTTDDDQHLGRNRRCSPASHRHSHSHGAQHELVRP